MSSSKTAVITGGTSGIGLETASALLRAGFRVVVLGRDAAKGAAAVTRLGSGASFDRCDVGVASDVERVARDIGARTGRIDALVNCAGVLQRNSLRAATAAELAGVKTQLDTILWGTIVATTQFAELLAGGMQPIIVNVGSVAGRQPFRTLSAYGAAKAAVSFFTQASAQELYTRGIRVVCVAPGVVETPLMPSAELGMLKANIPGRRLQRPEEIARLIASLITGDFPSLTGTTIDLHDGAGFFDVGPAPERARSAPAAPGGPPSAAGDDPLDAKLKAIFREVFAVSPELVRDDTGPEDIIKWDSLGHLRLVAAIEREFKCSLSVDDAMELTSVLAIKQVVRRFGG